MEAVLIIVGLLGIFFVGLTFYLLSKGRWVLALFIWVACGLLSVPISTGITNGIAYRTEQRAMLQQTINYRNAQNAAQAVSDSRAEMEAQSKLELERAWDELDAEIRAEIAKDMIIGITIVEYKTTNDEWVKLTDASELSWLNKIVEMHGLGNLRFTDATDGYEFVYWERID